MRLLRFKSKALSALHFFVLSFSVDLLLTPKNDTIRASPPFPHSFQETYLSIFSCHVEFGNQRYWRRR